MNAGQFIQWHDLFIMIDDGSIPLVRYRVIAKAMHDQAIKYPDGIAVLCILPPETRPPSEEVKTAVRDTLANVMNKLSCLSYLVEGTGFRGIAARASIVGMKIFAARPYPINVETSMYEVLSKIWPYLKKGNTEASDVTVIANVIADARRAWNPEMLETLQPGLYKP